MLSKLKRLSRVTKSSSSKSSGSGKKDKVKEKSKRKPVDEKDMLKLYIAIYRPSQGIRYHWAFSLHDAANSHWYIFDGTRARINGPLLPRTVEVSPWNSQKCIATVQMASCHPDDLDEILEVVRGVKIQRGWGCQAYVVSMFRELIERGFVDEGGFEEAWKGGAERWFGDREEDFGEAKERGPISDECVYDSEEAAGE